MSTKAQLAKERGDWRGVRDYRSIYFKHNPGLFGKLWFCSQCGKPLWGKHKVQVDHGKAPSTFNSFAMKDLFNNEFNLVAACGPCNREKSNKGGIYTQKAFLAKIVEKVMFKTQDLVVLTAWGGKTVVSKTAGALIPGQAKRGSKISSKPKLLSESVTGTLFAVIIFILTYAVYGVIKFAKGLGLSIIKTVFKLLAAPITSKGSPWWAKIAAIVSYAAIGYYFWNRLFG